MYRVVQKVSHRVFGIAASNGDRFSKLFHYMDKICNGITKDSTTPQKASLFLLRDASV